MLDSIIPGMLLEEDLTGYDIKKRIENGIGVFYKASFGSLYPALKKLTLKGCLSTYEKPQGGRRKIFYHITEKGMRDFYEWLSAPTDVLDGTNAHLAKVYFFDKLPSRTRERQLLLYERNNIDYLKRLYDLEKKFDALENRDCCYYKLSTLYYGICMTRETLRWCRHVRTQKPLSDLLRPDGEGGSEAHERDGSDRQEATL